MTSAALLHMPIPYKRKETIRNVGLFHGNSKYHNKLATNITLLCADLFMACMRGCMDVCMYRAQELQVIAGGAEQSALHDHVDRGGRELV